MIFDSQTRGLSISYRNFGGLNGLPIIALKEDNEIKSDLIVFFIDYLIS